MKYGRAIKIMAIRIIRSTLETKYGKIHSRTPDRRAMPRRCFFPYTKYPKPIEANNTPHIIDAELSIIFLSFFYRRIALLISRAVSCVGLISLVRGPFSLLSFHLIQSFAIFIFPFCPAVCSSGQNN